MATSNSLLFFALYTVSIFSMFDLHRKFLKFIFDLISLAKVEADFTVCLIVVTLSSWCFCSLRFQIQMLMLDKESSDLFWSDKISKLSSFSPSILWMHDLYFRIRSDKPAYNSNGFLINPENQKIFFRAMWSKIEKKAWSYFYLCMCDTSILRMWSTLFTKTILEKKKNGISCSETFVGPERWQKLHLKWMYWAVLVNLSLTCTSPRVVVIVVVVALDKNNVTGIWLFLSGFDILTVSTSKDSRFNHSGEWQK